MNKIRNALRLFRDFLRFGFFSFGGGWSIVTQMRQQYVEKENSLTGAELLDLTSVGMIFGVVVSLSLENYVTAAGALNVFSLGIAALDLVLLLKAKLPVPVVLGLSALLGIFLFGVLKIPM